MAKNTLWHDEYWLLLMQLYLSRPQGVKPLYSRALVGLAMELHIEPAELRQRMERLEQHDTPRLQQLWHRYATQPRRLSRAVRQVRGMKGFGAGEAFYEGVEVNESWERWFKPLPHAEGRDPLTPAKLIMMLDLYFRLVPLTMVPQTPEVIELAALLRSTPAEVVDVMEVFRFCDPQLTTGDLMIHPLLAPCMQVWKRWGNAGPEKVAALARELEAYWK